MRSAISLRIATVLFSALTSQAGLHPGVNQVSEDLVGEHVPDRAGLELCLRRSMFGDVGEPELVRAVGGELAPGSARRCRSRRTDRPGPVNPGFLPSRPQTTSCRPMRSATPCDPTSLRRRRGPCRRATRCPNPGSSLCASNSAFVRYASTTSLVVIGLCQPPVVGLAGERVSTRHLTVTGIPAAASSVTNGYHRNSRYTEINLVASSVTSGYHPFPSRFARNRYPAAHRNTSFPCPSNQTRLHASRNSTDSVRV